MFSVMSANYTHLYILPPSLSLSQVAQVAAKTLGIPTDMVKVKPTGVLTNPNGHSTRASITTELNCIVSL